jgi:hypothetical protein
MALHREERKRLRVHHRDFGLAWRVNSVPLAAIELSAAAHTPTVFAKIADELPALAALVGLQNDENFFVEASYDQWIGGHLPAFVRRDPFVLAVQGEAFVAWIDRAFGGWSEITRKYDQNEVVRPRADGFPTLTEVSVL